MWTTKEECSTRIDEVLAEIDTLIAVITVCKDRPQLMKNIRYEIRNRSIHINCLRRTLANK